MRIRKPFAAAFVGLCLISALAGFSPQKYNLPYRQSDKVLHFLAFFGVTLTFYWILETSRRKVLQLTFAVCTVGLGALSEVIQGLIPNNGREFDPYDILANVAGSAAALALCNWYHKRMLERKRAARGYAAVAGDDLGDVDIELGEGVGGQETGVVRSGTAAVEEELEHWDENAEDWDDTEAPENSNGQAGDGDLGVVDTKKRND